MIAYVGNAPQISTYEPGLDIAKESNIPFDLFNNIMDAYEWLNVHPDEQG